MSEWESLPNGVSWKQPPYVCFRRSRASLEEAFGPPHSRDTDPKGLGPVDVWALRFRCGLEIVVMALHLAPDGVAVLPGEETWVEMNATDGDIAHVASHFPFELGQLSPWLPDRRTYPPRSWKVMRQDDNGIRAEVRQCSSKCEAEHQAHSLERLGHKQTFWVEQQPHAG